MNSPMRLPTGLLILLLVVACATTSVPPVGKEGSLQLAEDERHLWKEAKEEQQKLDNSGRIDEDAELTAYLNTVAAKLTPTEVKGKGLSFKVRIIKNPLLNAFTYPNGVIYVHTGILARMDNEAQLATLLAHEMNHATHRHTIQQYRNFKNTTDFMATLQVAGAPLGVIGSMVGLMGAIGAMASVSGYSQEMEAEADREGLKLMVQAGYDPQEAPKLFLHLKTDVEEQQQKEPFFFGSHPRLQERIGNYSELLKTSYANQRGATGSEHFTERMLPLLVENTELDLAMGRFDSAQHGIDRVLRQSPQNASVHYYQGELYRQRDKEGDSAKALQAYSLAARYDPTLAEPHKALGLIYFKKGSKAEARREFEKYLLLAPNAADRNYIEQYLREL